MKRYELRPKRPTLIAGRKVTPADVIGTVETDLAIHDLLALAQFGNADICCVTVDPDPAEPTAAPASAEEPAEEPADEAVAAAKTKTKSARK